MNASSSNKRPRVLFEGVTLLITGTEVICPQGTPGAVPLVIDLAKILKAEARQEEVATTNATKAPELLKTLNRSWLDLSETLARLFMEKGKAAKAVDKRRSILVLEVVPGKLKEKGLTSNDANREAVIQLDEEHERLEDTLLQITAVVKYLEGKLHSFENAFSSVKKILGNDQSWMRDRPNPNLSGDSHAPTSGNMISRQQPTQVTNEMPPNGTEEVRKVSGFGTGRPKFGR